MTIKYMEMDDEHFVLSIDRQMTELSYKNRVQTKSGYVMWENKERIGILHYSFLWDHLPFLNLIFVKESHRNKGFASQALSFWEADMKRQGYQMVLVSTQADERAQFLYRKCGYIDCGALFFYDTPMDQPTELFFRKNL